MLQPVTFRTTAELRQFLRKLKRNRDITIEESLKGRGLKPPASMRYAIRFTDKFPETNFIIARNGNTYLLSDLLKMDETETLESRDILFPAVDGKDYSIKEVIELAKSGNLAKSNLLFNKHLIEALGSVRFSIKPKTSIEQIHIHDKGLLNVASINCPITRDTITIPAINLMNPNQFYEHYALIRNVVDHDKDPVNLKAMDLSDIIVNHAVADLYYVDFCQRCAHYLLLLTNAITTKNEQLEEQIKEALKKLIITKAILQEQQSIIAKAFPEKKNEVSNKQEHAAVEQGNTDISSKNSSNLNEEDILLTLKKELSKKRDEERIKFANLGEKYHLKNQKTFISDLKGQAKELYNKASKKRSSLLTTLGRILLPIVGGIFIFAALTFLSPLMALIGVATLILGIYGIKKLLHREDAVKMFNDKASETLSDLKEIENIQHEKQQLMNQITMQEKKVAVKNITEINDYTNRYKNFIEIIDSQIKKLEEEVPSNAMYYESEKNSSVVSKSNNSTTATFFRESSNTPKKTKEDDLIQDTQVTNEKSSDSPKQ